MTAGDLLPAPCSLLPLPMIKYLGSKRVLVPAIVKAIAEAADAAGGGGGAHGRTVLDPFSGTARVGHALKGAGWRVIAGDHNAYAAVLARCYVEADADSVLRDAAMLVDEFNHLAASSALTPGWFTEVYCQKSRYFRPENGERIEAVRNAIAAKSLEPELEAVMLASLMEAADRVDSTVGVQMAYLKRWSPRSGNALELRVPGVLPRAAAGKGEAVLEDAHELVARQSESAAVTYLDPPYNQHSYLGNYHVWETLVRWDRPAVFGVACKREDCRTRRSGFNAKGRAADELRRLIAAVKSPALVVSFSDEGFIRRDELLGILAASFAPPGGAASVRTIEIGHRRYVGARIGIYNPRGEKVGRVGKLTNTEHIYIAHRCPAGVPGTGLASVGPLNRVERAVDAASGSFSPPGGSLDVDIGHDFVPETVGT